MLDACLDPEMASEITLQPVRRHGVDAAIFFSDIVVPLKAAGVDVEIKPGLGQSWRNRSKPKPTWNGFPDPPRACSMRSPRE